MTTVYRDKHGKHVRTDKGTHPAHVPKPLPKKSPVPAPSAPAPAKKQEK